MAAGATSDDIGEPVSMVGRKHVFPRVLFVSHTGTMSGAEYVLANMTRDWPNGAALVLESGPLPSALKANGLDVSVMDEASLKTIRRSGSLSAAVSLARPLMRMVREIARRGRGCDVVYANSQKAFLLSALARPFFRRPLVWHLHDILDDRHFGPGQRRMQVMLANRLAALVVVPSAAVADAFVANGGRADHVRIVANGVPAADLVVDRIGYRRQIGLPDGPMIGVFSRIAAWKGQHVVIEALAHLPGVSCLIAGSALFGEDDYRRRLEDDVRRLGLSDRVFFLGQRQDVPALMHVVDVVVHPSVDPEPFGLTVVEAMLVGTPVIATEIGACADILDNGKAGTLVAPGSPDEIAQAVRTVLEDADGRGAERIAHARQRARSLYDIGTMRERLMVLIAGLDGGHRTRMWR